MRQRPALRQGSRGDLVLAWQWFLVGHGFRDLVATGTFDLQTDAQTRAYQRQNALVADGIVGNRTLGVALTQGFPLIEDHDLFPPRPTDIAPLVSPAIRETVLGDLQWRPAPTPADPDTIVVLNDWVQTHVITVEVPQLVKRGLLHPPGRVQFHKDAANAFLGFWADVEAEDLLDLVKSWDGAFATRLSRGSTHPSMHAFASAFDINATYNRLGHVPPYAGELGSVRPLVEIAHTRGFFWGGHFHGRVDGMHFEVTTRALRAPLADAA